MTSQKYKNNNKNRVYYDSKEHFYKTQSPVSQVQFSELWRVGRSQSQMKVINLTADVSFNDNVTSEQT